MVLEQFIVRIHAGREAEFEVAMEHALRTVMSRSPGVQGWSLRRCVETPDRYQVQIQWNTLDDHMVTYRQGDVAPAFRAIVMPFFAEPSQMMHFEELAKS
jgi:heme-degrading monooxygenase HmoA